MLIIHIAKIGANDVILSLRHYDVECTLPYTIAKGDDSQVIHVDVKN